MCTICIMWHDAQSGNIILSRNIRLTSNSFLGKDNVRFRFFLHLCIKYMQARLNNYIKNHKSLSLWKFMSVGPGTIREISRFYSVSYSTIRVSYYTVRYPKRERERERNGNPIPWVKWHFVIFNFHVYQM